MGLSILTGLYFIKMMWGFGKTPLLLPVISTVPTLLILWNLIQVWRGNYHDTRKLERLCRNTLFVNLSMTMILTIRFTIMSAAPHLTPSP
jgi:hypothetical protein